MIRPVADKILCRIVKDEAESKIIIPDTVKKDADDDKGHFIIIAKGEDVDDTLNVGDTVYMIPQGGIPVRYEDEILVFFYASQVLGVLEEKKEMN